MSDRAIASSSSCEVNRQVGTLRHLLVQQAVGVLVRSTLPRAVRVCKIDLNAGTLGQDLVAVHLAALVVSHRLAHDGRFAVQHGREAVDDGLGGRVVHLGEHHEAGGALDQRTDRGTVASAFDQVAFPVAGDGAVLDLDRADVMAWLFLVPDLPCRSFCMSGIWPRRSVPRLRCLSDGAQVRAHGYDDSVLLGGQMLGDFWHGSIFRKGCCTWFLKTPSLQI